jgi:endo-1,4-beta-xylanase
MTMTCKKTIVISMRMAGIKCATALAAGMLLLGAAWGQNSAPSDAASAPNSMPKRAPDSDNETLRQYADKMDFGVGVFIQPRYWKLDPRHQQIMGREFNRAVTFPDKIQVERGHYDFELMDEEMRFAKQHNMKLFGAGLLYRNTASPEWLHFGKSCGGWSEHEIDEIIKDDITTIVRHGGDMYYAWEVVNEPVSMGHNGCWTYLFGGYEHGGQDKMIAKASQYAHEANPNVPILLNDTFGQEGLDKGKVDDFFSLIKRVRALGGHIDAVGSEMHLEAHRLRPTYVDEFQYFLDQARKNNLQAQVTEMDVYQGPAGAFQDPYENQKQIFYNIAHACLKDSNCTTFTVWGLYDEATWLRGAKGLTDANPVLFDSNYKKKPAYYGVLEALKDGR